MKNVIQFETVQFCFEWYWHHPSFCTLLDFRYFHCYFLDLFFDLRFFPFFTRVPFLIGLNFMDFLILLSCWVFRCSVSLEDFLFVLTLWTVSECFLFFPGFVVASLDFRLLSTLGKSSAVNKGQTKKSLSSLWLEKTIDNRFTQKIPRECKTWNYDKTEIYALTKCATRNTQLETFFFFSYSYKHCLPLQLVPELGRHEALRNVPQDWLRKWYTDNSNSGPSP